MRSLMLLGMILALGGCAANQDFTDLAVQNLSAMKSFKADTVEFVTRQDALIANGDARVQDINAEAARMGARSRRQTVAWTATGDDKLVQTQAQVGASLSADGVLAALQTQTHTTPQIDNRALDKKLSDGIKAQEALTMPRSAFDELRALVGAAQATTAEFQRLQAEATKQAEAADKAADAKTPKMSQ